MVPAEPREPGEIHHHRTCHMPPVPVVGVVLPLNSEPRAGVCGFVLDSTAALRCCWFEVSAGTGWNVVGGVGGGTAGLLLLDPKQMTRTPLVYAART